MLGIAKIKDAALETAEQMNSLGNTAKTILTVLVVAIGLLFAAVVTLTTAVIHVRESVES